MARNLVESVFHAELLAPLADPARRFDFVAEPQHSFSEIFIGYDPASNTGFSEAVALGMIFDTVLPPPGMDRRAIIVSAERVPTNAYDAIADWLVNHGLILRKKLRLPHAAIVICIENNSIMVAHNVARAIELMRTPNVVVMREQRAYHRSGQAIPLIDVRPGIRTTHVNKEAGLNALRDLLLANALHFHKDFCVPNSAMMTIGDAANVRNTVVDEFTCMSAIYVEPKRHTTGSAQHLSNQGSGIKYFGMDANGKKKRDDYVMAAIFCILCYAPYHASSHFHSYTSGISAPRQNLITTNLPSRL